MQILHSLRIFTAEIEVVWNFVMFVVANFFSCGNTINLRFQKYVFSNKYLQPTKNL